MPNLKQWNARRSGARMVVNHSTGKEQVDLIEARNGKVVAVRFKPMETGRVYAEGEREVDEEFELLV